MTIIVQKKRTPGSYGIPNGGEILWYGIAANIPSGWTIDTACSNVFLKGCDLGSASNTKLGAYNHQHTNPASTGSVAAHTHPISLNLGDSSGSETVYPTSNDYCADQPHDHGGSGTSASNGGHSHTLSATSSVNAYPPYAKLYWIKNTSGVEAELPINGIVMWDNPIGNIPESFALCNGISGTIDLRDKFIFGAALDGDVGANGGGLTHTHGNSNSGLAGSHSHTFSATTTGASGSKDVSGFAGLQVSGSGHTHSVSGTTGTDSNHDHALSATGSASNLPPYLMLYFIQRLL